ncbi:MAG TPA: hypothetical protein VL463_08195, partial [Kofleriaceae bacterium]|nr:hypothetical protein [Kofleriaceae bacterium]
MASRYEDLCAQLRREFPRFRVIAKRDSRLQRAIHRALVILTFGGMRGYLDDFVTTIGSTIYVCSDWNDRSDGDRWATMRHEAVHLRQFRRWTLPGMALLYLLVPLPIGLAYFRMRFERAAYEETIRVNFDLYGMGYVKGELREHVIAQFT